MHMLCIVAHMITYLEQLKRLAAEHGVDLRSACKAEGIAQTTLMRWEKGEAHPREETAKALFARITATPNTETAPHCERGAV